jgi:hypothetical protein
MEAEENIVYEGENFYVIRTGGSWYEVRKNKGTHSVVVGASSSEANCIRTAKRLELHPNSV